MGYEKEAAAFHLHCRLYSFIITRGKSSGVRVHGHHSNVIFNFPRIRNGILRCVPRRLYYNVSGIMKWGFALSDDGVFLGWRIWYCFCSGRGFNCLQACWMRRSKSEEWCNVRVSGIVVKKVCFGVENSTQEWKTQYQRFKMTLPIFLTIFKTSETSIRVLISIKEM